MEGDGAVGMGWGGLWSAGGFWKAHPVPELCGAEGEKALLGPGHLRALALNNAGRKGVTKRSEEERREREREEEEGG